MKTQWEITQPTSLIAPNISHLLGWIDVYTTTIAAAKTTLMITKIRSTVVRSFSKIRDSCLSFSFFPTSVVVHCEDASRPSPSTFAKVISITAAAGRKRTPSLDTLICVCRINAQPAVQANHGGSIVCTRMCNEKASHFTWTSLERFTISFILHAVFAAILQQSNICISHSTHNMCMWLQIAISIPWWYQLQSGVFARNVDFCCF